MVRDEREIFVAAEPDFLQQFGDLEIEDDGKRKIVLGEDLELSPMMGVMAAIKIEGGEPGELMTMDARMTGVGREILAIPGGILENIPGATLRLSNNGDGVLRLKASRELARAKELEPHSEEAEALGVHTVSTTRFSDWRDLETCDLTVKEKEKLTTVLRRWTCCFALYDKDLGLTNLGEMEITLTTNIPIYHRPYRLSYAEKAIVRAKMHDLLQAGVIRNSHSSYASPIVLVPKKTGEARC